MERSFIEIEDKDILILENGEQDKILMRLAEYKILNKEEVPEKRNDDLLISGKFNGFLISIRYIKS